MDTNMSKIFVVSDTHTVLPWVRVDTKSNYFFSKGLSKKDLEQIQTMNLRDINTFRTKLATISDPYDVTLWAEYKNFTNVMCDRILSINAEYEQYLNTTFENALSTRSVKDFIAIWNGTVSPNDTVIHLGDVVHQTPTASIFNQLNGKKILVAGNHDMYKGKCDVELHKYFDEVHESTYSIDDIIFSHEPICPDVPKFALEKFKNINLDLYNVNIHGHFHRVGVTKEFLLKRLEKPIQRIFGIGTEPPVLSYEPDGTNDCGYITDVPVLHYCVYAGLKNLTDIQQDIRSFKQTSSNVPTRWYNKISKQKM